VSFSKKPFLENSRKYQIVASQAVQAQSVIGKQESTIGEHANLVEKHGSAV
jgi:hypothetical protein